MNLNVQYENFGVCIFIISNLKLAFTFITNKTMTIIKMVIYKTIKRMPNDEMKIETTMKIK